jgi:hypothetical protein
VLPPLQLQQLVGVASHACKDKHPHQSSDNDEGVQRCPVHNSKHHNIEECWETKKIAEQFREQ